MGPLSPEEQEGLLLTHTIDKNEVYAIEQENIESAVAWTFNKNIKAKRLLSESYIELLHKKMYGAVWKWAGAYRTTNKNIGVAYYEVPLELKKLLADANYWVQNETYGPIELAIRFKHRLVSIHCFPNGNGRHSRLMADLIMEKIYKEKFFTWGGSSLVKDDEKRTAYIKALKKADNGNLEDLISFAQS